MKTVLDLPQRIDNKRIYEAKTMEEIFEAIEKELSIINLFALHFQVVKRSPHLTQHFLTKRRYQKAGIDTKK
jgi:hypothetical protein